MAEDGARGEGSQRSGKSGKDEILEVPLGTVAKNFETGEQLCEINEEGQEFILMEGGMGGLGNTNFKTSTNQAPTYAQPGITSKEDWIVLELKVLADVGLVGFPNAGKSTLLAAVSAAKPEIADYPFTTLVPNLGIVDYRGGQSFVMADIPGIIEGAHEGKGLGIRFLRHIERNACLLFMVPIDSDDIMGQYKILLKELKLYNPELLQKERILAITKCDMVDEETREMVEKELKKKLPKKEKLDYLFISAASYYNIDELKDRLMDKINSPS
jgi:GTP-binding protein